MSLEVGRVVCVCESQCKSLTHSLATWFLFYAILLYRYAFAMTSYLSYLFFWCSICSNVTEYQLLTLSSLGLELMHLGGPCDVAMQVTYTQDGAGHPMTGKY